MLRSAVLRRLAHVAPAPNAAERRRRACGAEAKQRLERGHGLLPPIVSKDELVQVDLQLRSAHAVIRSDQPRLEVPDGSASGTTAVAPLRKAERDGCVRATCRKFALGSTANPANPSV